LEHGWREKKDSASIKNSTIKVKHQTEYCPTRMKSVGRLGSALMTLSSTLKKSNALMSNVSSIHGNKSPVEEAGPVVVSLALGV